MGIKFFVLDNIKYNKLYIKEKKNKKKGVRYNK